MRRRARKLLARKVLFLGIFSACLCTNVLSIRSSWLVHELASGQVRKGYFERIDGTFGLVCDDELDRLTFPAMGHDTEGNLSFPDDWTMAFPLKNGDRFTIHDSLSSFAPYCVFGQQIPLEPEATQEERLRTGNPTKLADARVIDVENDQLIWRDWDASRPLQEDLSWLRRLSAVCGGTEDSPDLSFAVDQDGIHIVFGSCTGQTPFPEAAGSRVMAVVAGASLPHLIRIAPTWTLPTSLDGWRLLSATCLSALSILLVQAGLVPSCNPVISLVLLLSSFIAPTTTLTLWILVFAFAIANLVGRLGIHLLRHAPLSMRSLGYTIATTISFFLVLAVPVWIMIFLAARTGPKEEFPNPDEDIASPRCLVIGYSTAGDGGLRRTDPMGVLSILNHGCEPCAGRTERVSWFGGTLPLVRNYLCSPDSHLHAGTNVVFLGGTNDDSVGGIHEHTLFNAVRFSPLFMFFYTVQMTVHEGLSTYLDLNTHDPDLRPDRQIYRRTLRWASEQSDEIRDILACTHAHKATFWFFQNFLLSDLYLGRCREKQELVDIRKRAVESYGGIFVDMLPELRSAVGVSWFNDTEHLSGIGYEGAAHLICEYLRQRQDEPTVLE